MSRLSPDVQAALRAAAISDDGLTLTLAGQLDRKVYQATAKAIEALGGKWNRKAKAHLFQTNARDVLARVLDGEALPKKNPLAYFATPEVLARQVVNAVAELDGVRVLEPSAGTGALADVLREYGAHVDVVELDDTRRAHLQGAGYRVVGTDFLAFTPSEPYPVVVMNPPFRSEEDAQAYIAHIEHAWAHCLAPGGTLVAIAPSGFTFRQDRRAVAFRTFVEEYGEFDLNDERAFVESGTGVQTVTLAVRKPAQEAAMPAKTTQTTQDPTPAEFQKMVEETRQKMQAPSKRGKKTAPAAAAPEVTAGSDADLPFPVTEAELDAVIPEPSPEVLFPVGSRVLVDDGTTGTVHSHYDDPGVMEEEGVRANGCFVAPDGWDGTPEALHDVAHVQLSAAPELPGTPVLISPADLAPGTLGLHHVPLHQTTRSACNVRNHYDPAAIEELAASIKAEGQIENATGRWTADGQVEIVAGESRRRAQLLRQDQGETGLTLMVNIRELADVDALRISATENMRRRKMTPLEECEAMLRMQEAGALMEDLTTTFGYKTAQPVADRILVARTLHTTGRELLDRGELSLACAMVIARAPGQDLQLSMIRDATSSWNRATAETLSKRLTQGQFLVKHAKFETEQSGLEIKRDLFDAFEPYFLDKAAALDAQTKWLEAKAERLRAKKKHAFVHVITDGKFDRYGRGPYTGYGSKGEAGLVFVLSPETGSVREENDVYLRAAATSTGEKATTARQISESAYQEAHELRARALRESVLGDTHLTLALTVWGLVLGAQPGEGRVKIAELNGLPTQEKRPELAPQLHARADALKDVLAPAVVSRSMGYHAVLTGYKPDPAALLELLLAMTDEELLGHLNTLVSVTAYDWSTYSNRAEPRREYALLASLTDAPQRLAQSFRLTDEWLKKYPRPDLVALAEEAGLGRALVEDCATLKEMRARILEHADTLHAAGFLPRLVQFPALTTTAPAAETAAD